jgi:hypothetical protein
LEKPTALPFGAARRLDQAVNSAKSMEDLDRARPLARAFGQEAAELVAALAIFARGVAITASGSISPFICTIEQAGEQPVEDPAGLGFQLVGQLAIDVIQRRSAPPKGPA